MKKLIVALIASAAAMSAAQAQTTAPRAYVGVGVASADHEFKRSGATNIDTEGYKASGKIFGGYDFNQTWGVEAGYTDFRKADVNYTTAGVNTRGETDGHSVYLAAKATMPVNEQFSVYTKLGAARNKSELVALNSAQNMSHSKTEAYGALGAQYNLNQNVSLIAEYERYGKSKDFGAKADVWTVGAKYAF
ncbi:outer membrane beta-barrel protein [Massilia yuzhufengensis]|uniref:OmpA-OmpF porin, OOP family n=1 Tax=Massilia yuzhufengensis TaxID=1164594 RepID=A0A1I1DL29_9BURK|nr:outer membrane beta-barrel protein [Massilia yuzhufengensis]SFB73420.1 OmpA-OmpF porin, OOP family [Massilia yuzhufengensis]